MKPIFSLKFTLDTAGCVFDSLSGISTITLISNLTALDLIVQSYLWVKTESLLQPKEQKFHSQVQVQCEWKENGVNFVEMKMLSLFTYPHVVPTPSSSSEHNFGSFA